MTRGIRTDGSFPIDPSGLLSPLHRIVLGLALALIAVLSVRQVGSMDVGFHLEAGLHILSGNGWPATDPFTYTLRDRPYVDTSWGYQVLLASVHALAGASGMIGLHVGLVLVAFLVALATARLRPVDPTALVLVFLLGGVASELRFETRPELVSWVWLACVLHLLARRAVGLAAPLFILPLVHLVWANTHGLFVLGWIAIACSALDETIRSRRAPRELLLWGLASVAVTLVNPYGWSGASFPFTLATRLDADNAFARSIGEFASPFDLRLSEQLPFYPRLPIWAFRSFVVAALFAVPGLVRRRRWGKLLLLAAFAGLAARMIRNVPLLILAGLPAVAEGLSVDAALAWLGIRRERSRRGAIAMILAAAGVAAIVLGIRVRNDAYYLASRRPERFGLGWNRVALPIDAASWARRVRIDGRVLNHLNFGGYLMWALDAPVFIDGRLEVVGEEFYERYRTMLASTEALESGVAAYGIRWIVFPYATNPDLLARLSRDSRWTLAWFDALAAVFVRSGPTARRFVDVALLGEIHAPSEAPPLDSLPGLGPIPRAGSVRRWLDGLASRRTFPTDEFNRGLFHYFRRELPQAQARFARAVALSGGAYYEIYNNLGATLWQQRREREAADCYRIVLEEDPSNRVARSRLATPTSPP